MKIDEVEPMKLALSKVFRKHLKEFIHMNRTEGSTGIETIISELLSEAHYILRTSFVKEKCPISFKEVWADLCILTFMREEGDDVIV